MKVAIGGADMKHLMKEHNRLLGVERLARKVIESYGGEPTLEPSTSEHEWHQTRFTFEALGNLAKILSMCPTSGGEDD